jgi:hypothetical protein
VISSSPRNGPSRRRRSFNSPASFWETLAGQQVRNQDRSRRGLLAAVALLYKRKAEILMMFDYGPDLDRQIRAIDAEIARRVEQVSEADRDYMIVEGPADPA